MSTNTSLLSRSVADVESSDEIYLYSTEDCEPRTATGKEQNPDNDDDDDDYWGYLDIQVVCKRGPSRSLQLVSRQFSSEYLDIVKKQAEIHFYDEYLSCESKNGWAPSLSDQLFTRFSNAKLYLLETSAHRQSDDLEHHVQWVSKMQNQFGILSKVDITLRLVKSGKPVYYPDNPGRQDSKFLGKVTTLIDLTGASTFEVIIGNSSESLGWTDLSRDDVFQKTSTSYGKWSKEAGWTVEESKQS